MGRETQKSQHTTGTVAQSASPTKAVVQTASCGPVQQREPVSEPQPHSHIHDPADKKRQLNRLSRIIGHLQYVKRMIEDDADCSEVLIQIAAARSALNGLGKQIINEHITHCVAHAIEDGDTEAIEEFQKAIEKYL